jgi:hypothetical protein
MTFEKTDSSTISTAWKYVAITAIVPHQILSISNGYIMASTWHGNWERATTFRVRAAEAEVG